MLKKFLRDVVIIVAGKQAEEISDLLNTKKHVNEFLIAKKLDITINQTRNILYKISDHGLVSSIRKKDKRKGWYTYFWKIEILKSLEFLKGIFLKRINQLKHQIKSRQTKGFYICESCNIEFNEENALLRDFICPECGKVFIKKDNTKLLRELKRNLDKTGRELALVEIEIKKEKDKIEKEQLKEIKKKVKAKKKPARKKLVKKKKKTVKKSKKKAKKLPKKKKKTVKKKTKKKPKKKPKKIPKKKKVIKKKKKKKTIRKVKKPYKKSKKKKKTKKKKRKR